MSAEDPIVAEATEASSSVITMRGRPPAGRLRIPPRQPPPRLSPRPPETAAVAQAFRAFMESLGLDLEDPDLAETDQRVARAYAELFAGLRPGSEPALSTFPNTERHQGVVTVTGIPFHSLCSHHFLPFFGTADVGYVPSDRLVGLSKMPRLVEHYARRPQLQERLAEQIAHHLDEHLSPAGVIVVLRARHLCMEMRGVRRRGTTTTVAARGVLQQAEPQERFFQQVRLARASASEEE